MRKQNGAQRSRILIFTTSIILYLAYTISQIEWLAPFISIFSILAILISFMQSSKPTKIMATLFVGLGSLFIYQQNLTLFDYMMAYGDMLYLLSLFAIVPLLGIPIQIGGYKETIQHAMQKITSVNQLYRTISSFSFLLGSFLNLAAPVIVYSSVKNIIDHDVKQNRAKFASISIIQGFSLPIMWTPFSGMVGTVILVTGASWLSIFPFLLAMALCSLVVNWAVFHLDNKKTDQYQMKQEFNKQTPHHHPYSASAKKTDSIDDNAEFDVNQKSKDGSAVFTSKRKLIEMGMAILLLICVVMVVDQFTTWGLIVTVTVVSIPCAFIWSLCLKKSGSFMSETKSYITHQIPKMNDQFSIFLSTGFFVQALHISGYDQVINELFLGWNGFLGIYLFLILLPLIILLFSYIGLHPLVIIALLGESLDPLILGITAEELSIALLGGAVLTFMIGPFSGTLGLMSSLLHVQNLTIAYWNLKYTIVYFFMLVTALLLFHFFI